MVFPEKKLEYNLFLSAINFINYEKERVTKMFTFALSIFSKNSIIENISVLEDLNIKQIDINKTNLCWSDWFTI